VLRYQFVLAWLPLILAVVGWLAAGSVAAGPCPTPESGGC
jgi:hypothetical protein